MPSPYSGKSVELAASLSLTERLLTLYRQRKTQGEDHNRFLWLRMSRWYDLYRGFYLNQSPLTAFRNHIHIPFTFSIIQGAVSRKVAASFTTWPYVEFIPIASDQAPSARKSSVLVASQWDACDTLQKAVDFYLSGEMYGTGIGRVGWQNIVRFERHRVRELLADGSTAEQLKDGWVTRFDGMNWDVVDITDFIQQPGVRRLKNMDWVMHRYIQSYDTIEGLERFKYYRAGTTAALRFAGMPEEVEHAYKWRASIYRTRTDYEARSQETFNKPVVCVDMIGSVPDWAAINGVTFCLTTVLNDRVVARHVEFPNWNGVFPFVVATPQADPHYFHGIGKAEIIEKMQYMSNKIASQKADAGDVNLDPMYIINRMAGIDTAQLITRAGKIIGVDGPVDDTVIKPLFPDLRNFQVAQAEIAQYWQWAQQGTGMIEDTVLGGSMGDRQTKAEFLGRQENVMNRLSLEALLMERDFVVPLAIQTRELCYQYLDLPKELLILGPDAEIDPLTGLAQDQKAEVVDLADLRIRLNVRAVGAMQQLSKSVRRQDALTLLQVVSSNPIAAQALNWVAFFRYIFKTFDVPNPNEFLVTNTPTLLNAAQNGPAAAESGTGGDIMQMLG